MKDLTEPKDQTPKDLTPKAELFCVAYADAERET